MHWFFHKKIFTPFLAALLAAACITGTAAFFCVSATKSGTGTAVSDGRPLKQIYKDAVIDAVTAEEEELFPLVTITEDSKKVSWKDGNIIRSYFSNAYPWTRLGYTYDWSPGSGEYGLTEFLIRPGTEVRIECNQHLERDLQKAADDNPDHTWAKEMKDLISLTIKERNDATAQGKEKFPKKPFKNFKRK